MLIRRSEETSEEIKVLKLEQLLAKTFQIKVDGEKGVQSLFAHCLLTGIVARELASRFPEPIRKQLFPVGVDLLAAVHDTGKAYPAFQAKIYRAALEKRVLASEQYPSELVGINPDHDKQNGYHWSVSRAALQRVNSCAAKIAGRHHGVQPVTMISETSERYGGMAWQHLREDLVSLLADSLHSSWPHIPDYYHALPIAGLVSVSDWIASSMLSPSTVKHAEIDVLYNDVKKRVDQAGFLVPRVKKGLSFSDIFHGYSPRALQYSFYKLTIKPGVYCLEAEMGTGKTEAALYAAYSLLERGEAGGIYFALPTRLTSEKIYDRFGDFLSSILEPGAGSTTPLLLHGASWMKWSELGEAGEPGNEWFQTKRRAILAPFGVGTIDQALMAVMNVKYGFVRAFGLAGKVVILDEVHSYDSYTGTILDTLVDTLRRLGATVIILSATLTGNRRRFLIGDRNTSTHKEGNEPYPLISSDIGDFQTVPITQKEKRNVTVQCVADYGECIKESLERAENGQQVLWIENSVGEAQKIYRILAARSGSTKIEIGLLHSRFTGCDREEIENNWVSLFGKESRDKRYLRGRILVGTQVFEQSLDIDADFMISRIAPTDMLIQRIGRLWRHTANDRYRPSSSRREMFILVPPSYEIVNNPGKVFGISGLIYSPYVLARSAELWSQRDTLLLPDDIRGIIEETYSERSETVLAPLKDELVKVRERLASLAALGLVQEGITLQEGEAATRYSDRESVELLLLKNILQSTEGVSITLLNGKNLEISKDKGKISTSVRKQYAIDFQENTLQVAVNQAPDAVPKGELSWLSPYLYIGKGKYVDSHKKNT